MNCSLRHSEPPARSSIKVLKQRVEGATINPPVEDSLAIEDPLEIVLRYRRGELEVEKKLLVTMRTPGADSCLIHGLLYSEGIINSSSDILNLSYEGDGQAAPTRAFVTLAREELMAESVGKRHWAANASCGVCGTNAIENLALAPHLKLTDEAKVSVQLIHALPNLMRSKQATFDRTGGLHAAAIFTSRGELLASHEDIGRHNALDKVIGELLCQQRLDQEPLVLAVSGRMSYEIIQKALMARLSIVAGVGAPSSLAVSMAADFNLTLIGFVRDNSYNIYSCPKRLI